ncbi:glycosyltransferase family A protein [Halorubrum sp. PV6]|uniref:glycosyltransferase family 2 protein n=1 Tax=Halorubrum sp. PV6 TaxID=634157 RepID=UPI000EB6D1A5|nr:glycosyltransferase family A protein [Halorubrum sp. PV6]AYD49524.1 glycosyltransferase [Halorubrum sp. PV6]AZQ14290.1 glycosyltransferase family 2 protein [Halorubrum sp. PV6]
MGIRERERERSPEVSVVIPIYNQPQLIEAALNSVAEQSLERYEVVVVDDASNADFKPIVNAYDDRVRLLTHEENRGAAAARNTGIEHANGEYVAFLDADDTWEPTKLEKQREVFENDDELGLVYTGFVQYELDGSEWERYPEARGKIYVDELERDRVHPTSTVMVQRDILAEVGGFDTNLPSRQDYDLWLRITEYYEVDYVDEILVDKREQPDSISKDFDSRIEGDLAVFEKVKKCAADLDFLTRSRIYSYHHHVIGRDYESNGDRWKALKHLGLAIVRYPFRPVSYGMFIIALFGIDRNGPLLMFAKRFIR